MRIMELFVTFVIFFSFCGLLIAQSDSQVAGKCMTCHKEKSPGLYNQWYNSKHALHKVTCIDCHKAEKGEPDAFMHEGALIATLVTPKDCGACHAGETEEVNNSYHASAGLILESTDAYLAHVSAGEPVEILGCESCHGARIEIDESRENKLSVKSWPNSGIGRINPDGSKGSCNACHTRHSFAKSQARQPESCSKCHLGPDHPQREIYEESKHGNTYYTNIDKMNLDSDRWVVGLDYYVAPSCATCHMSATPTSPLTHDVGRRISWTLRPKVSVHKENWQSRRRNMKQVCINCHGQTFVDGHYYLYDAVVRLYNDKFAIPAGEIMNMIESKNLRKNPADFANKVDWIYWELWHHEGRRARHGASMMGPDYTWWHGMYEVAKHFYTKFIPEVRHFEDPDLNAYLDSLIAEDPMHGWVTRPTSDLKEKLRTGEIQELYQQYYDGEQDR